MDAPAKKPRNIPKRRPRTKAPIKLKHARDLVPQTAAEAAIATQLPARVFASGGHAPSLYDPVRAARVLEAVSAGATLSKACAELDVPITATTFHSWVLQRPELRKLWDEAKRIKAGAIFDQVQNLANKLINAADDYGKEDASTVNAIRTGLGTLQWMAGKLNPQEYGERMPAVPHVMVQINTDLDLGQGGPRVEREGPFTYTATVVQEMPDNPLQPKELDHAVKAR
jgi:hypothetical protein